jgi:hypothetical protein
MSLLSATGTRRPIDEEGEGDGADIDVRVVSTREE